MFKKYLSVICFVVTSSLYGMEKTLSTTELKRSEKSSSKKNNIIQSSNVIANYLQFFEAHDQTKSELYKLFKESSGFNGGDCDGFRVAKKIIESDCNICFENLLKIYQKSEVFLTCRSTKTKETIVHYMFKNVNNENYVQFFKDTYRLLHLHNILARAVDKKGNLPTVPEGQLDTVEVEALNNLLLKYEEKDIVPSSLLGYYLKKKMFKEARQIISSYNPKESTFLTNVDTKQNRTYAHFIVYLMRRDTFFEYLDILKDVLKFYPDLLEKKDELGGLPLDCLDEDTLRDEQLTEDQVKILIKILNKKFDLGTWVRSHLKKLKIM